ncbi:pectinesterase family protein [Salinimicrobium oceani]|uniref:Pectin methylesterase n=1 Tax=Salinimicrobium oceani TaxID=2722702 RepID=A0ABX1CY74_9FLAO|nr:pectinesterase family protein [Salinimicrobium oceani]NJW52097.1 pectin methylesterase [Salinimicrobium oceani]
MHKTLLKNLSLLLLTILATAATAQSQQLAFPSAEGFGRYATGGRGGIVYTVTNLNDTGEGSLRKGILKDGPRTIVFAVSGTIELERPLDINKGDLTIAGQTAPGQGITIKGYPVAVKDDNVIIRYMRFRMGDIKGTADDSFKGRDVKNVILDHCSISWATDENASFYQNKDFTMQWCIISEALNSSVHSKGDHGYGGIWGGENVSFHHNLIANNYSRNPRFSGSKTTENLEGEFVDFRNNVIYNWADNSIYGGENGRYNIVNNYFKPGPATEDKERIVEPYDPFGKFYVHGNYVEGSKEVSENNWNGGVQGDDPEAARVNEPFSFDKNVETHDARKAFDLVLKNAGDSRNRDAVDIRIINETRSGKATYGNGIIDSQEQVGGWPKLKAGTAPKDSDEDGMPDAWEKAKGLNPAKNDASGHTLDKAYTNLEVYLNELVDGKSGIAAKNSSSYDFIVAADGTADFMTVQEAINAVPDFRKNRTRIFIKSGTYKEKLVLPASKTNVTFIGEDLEKTILTYDDFAQKLNEFGEEIGTTGSTSFYVFGDGFHASNITFENSAGPIGQAVAVRIDGDKVIFDTCRFLGFQDTLYPHGKNSRQYYRNCYIEGTTDFIFGWSTAVFENCEIYSKEEGHYITAASTEEGTDHGFVFLNCNLTGNAPAGSVYLGRPWRPFAQTVFINTKMGEHIKKEGWHNWNKPHAEQSVFYAESNNSGPGYTPSKRVKWAKILSPEEAEKYTVKNILAGSDSWDPSTIEIL